ncbi:redoxin domain-containing protein [Halorubrum sp. DTA98]|uniref:redoxin domain-containing protein n=1 Tax=Halorubrum sp. DTA98 TaxID=3402163 RepID=UPI003AAD99FB
MVTEGESAPDFTVPKAGGDGYDDVTDFTLSEAIGDGPIVLAFVPGAFTGGCTEEMCTIGREMDGFEALDASVFGVSVDLPFAQNEWIRQEGFDVPMLSDWDHELVHAYDVVYENMYGSIESAQRSVFVIDDDGIVTYRWVRDGDNPAFEPFVSDLQDRVSDAREA